MTNMASIPPAPLRLSMCLSASTSLPSSAAAPGRLTSAERKSVIAATTLGEDTLLYTQFTTACITAGVPTSEPSVLLATAESTPSAWTAASTLAAFAELSGPLSLRTRITAASAPALQAAAAL
eukprot:CAMPEP_0172002478 /NCGR_PEP_ID=MMETSP1041-20130122/3432_1 /TAXON_ID=464988 /ORGANISM="Hemiselmis andersenii, Strain CCMP439" /LENGTH=122 /DNA_ID=CAMNT_0012656203 /DNA_START=393 /DNA_END=761 /DNA_ORIENTATION=-